MTMPPKTVTTNDNALIFLCPCQIGQEKLSSFTITVDAGVFSNIKNLSCIWCDRKYPVKDGAIQL